jgi:hypothetical protein
MFHKHVVQDISTHTKFIYNVFGNIFTGITSPYNTTTYIIEGNYNDKVARRSKSLNDSSIGGYGVNGGTSLGIIPTNSTSNNEGTTR